MPASRLPTAALPAHRVFHSPTLHPPLLSVQVPHSMVWTLMLALFVLLYAGIAARAHDAPSGWSYPFSCCSGYDCRPVAARTISERPEGYVIAGTGEVVGYGDERIRSSPDDEYHWCSVSGADDGKTICLFVPPRGF